MIERALEGATIPASPLDLPEASFRCDSYTDQQTGHRCTRRSTYIVEYDDGDVGGACWQHARDLPWPTRRVA